MAGQKDIVEGLFETFNTQGGDAVLDYLRENDALSPDFGARIQADAPSGGDWPGVEGYRRMVEIWMETWETFQVRPREYEMVGEGWLVRVTQAATTPDGMEVEDSSFIYTIRFLDGRVCRLGIWNDEEQARAELTERP